MSVTPVSWEFAVGAAPHNIDQIAFAAVRASDGATFVWSCGRAAIVKPYTDAEVRAMVMVDGICPDCDGSLTFPENAKGDPVSGWVRCPACRKGLVHLNYGRRR